MLTADQDYRSRRLVRGHILFTIVVLCVLGLCFRLRHVLQILYVSGLFAVVLTPVVKRIEMARVRTWHPSKPVAVLVLFAGIVAAFGLFFWIGLPPVANDFSNFIGDLPNRIPQILSKLRSLPVDEPY